MAAQSASSLVYGGLHAPSRVELQRVAPSQSRRSQVSQDARPRKIPSKNGANVANHQASAARCALPLDIARFTRYDARMLAISQAQHDT